MARRTLRPRPAAHGSGPAAPVPSTAAASGGTRGRRWQSCWELGVGEQRMGDRLSPPLTTAEGTTARSGRRSGGGEGRRSPPPGTRAPLLHVQSFQHADESGLRQGRQAGARRRHGSAGASRRVVGSAQRGSKGGPSTEGDPTGQAVGASCAVPQAALKTETSPAESQGECG